MLLLLRNGEKYLKDYSFLKKKNESVIRIHTEAVDEELKNGKKRKLFMSFI